MMINALCVSALTYQQWNDVLPPSLFTFFDQQSQSLDAADGTPVTLERVWAVAEPLNVIMMTSEEEEWKEDERECGQ